jgi:hypothetical protein
MALAALICALTPYNNAYLNNTPLGGGHFPLAPFIALVWLVFLAAFFNRVFRRPLLSGRELLFVWALAALGSGIAWTGLARTFFSNLAAPVGQASAGNHFAEVLHPLMPKAWYPEGAAALDLLSDGLPGGARMGWLTVLGKIPWDAWAMPLAVWGCFVFLVYFILSCLAGVLGRQWLTNERMAFPLLQVPRLLTESLDSGKPGKFLSDRFLLAGLAATAFLHCVNGLHAYFPSVPEIPALFLPGSYVPATGLFSGFLKTRVYIYPAFIGLAFLAGRQVSFSFWFFYVAGALFLGVLSVTGTQIPASALGTTFGPTLARPEECQMIGAYFVYFIFIIWLARRHLRDVLRDTLGGGTARTDARWSGRGLLIGIGLLTVWFRYSGMPLPAAALFIPACLAVLIVATRVICQGGLPYMTLTAAPLDGLLAFFGTRVFTAAGLFTAAVAQKVLFLDMRETLMPGLVHARKVTDGAPERRLVSWAVAGTLVLCVAVSFAAMLALCHRHGLREMRDTWAAETAFAVVDNVRSLVEGAPAPGHWPRVFALAGAGVMLVLAVCYHRFFWWPLHPVGYLTAYSSAMRILWFSFLAGWAANVLCMRYGGVRLYQRARLFFAGLVAGDFLAGGFFASLGFITGEGSLYQVFPL